MPSAAWIATAVAGNVLSGVEVPTTIRSIDCASTLRVLERGARRLHAEVGGELAGGRDVALADAGALHDPLVRRVDRPGEVGVGDGALGQIAAAAEDDGTRDGHEAASTFAASSRAWRTSVSLILLSSS